MSGGDWKDLYKGVSEGNYDLVDFHIKNGVDINYQHPEILMTPLVTAIKSGYTEIALLLLREGADPWLVSYYDNLNSVEAALIYKNKDVISELRRMGCRIGFKVKLKIFISRFL